MPKLDEPDDIMLNEISQMQTENFYMISLNYGIFLFFFF